MAPGHFQRRLQLGFAQRGERRAGPAAPPPGIVERRKGVWRDRAFERLLVRREFDVGGAFVRRQRREGDAGLEGAAIEMRIFAGALERERDAAEQGGVGHCELRLLGRTLCYELAQVFERRGMKPGTSAIVIGAGPAGLMAAE